MPRGWNLPDDVSPSDPTAPWNQTEQEEENYFVIKNTETGDYWSNDLGWTEYLGLATQFTEEEKDTFLYIPLDGEWKLFEGVE